MKWNWHGSMKSVVIVAWLGSFALAAWPAAAQAGFLSQYTGNTQMSGSGTSVGGVIDFAVYQNPTGHNWAADLGVTSALSGSGIDTTANYVYFYEVVNTAPDPGDGMIGHFNVGDGGTPFTSGGWLNGYVFNDAANKPVGPPSNPFLGPAASGDDPFANQPSHSGVTLGSPPFTNDGVVPTNPTGVASLGGVAGGGTATFLWTILFGNSLLGQNSYSPVLFFTSGSSPGYTDGSISGSSGLNPADGGIPGQAPEPATMVMWGLGSLGGLVFGRKAFRKKAAAVTA